MTLRALILMLFVGLAQPLAAQQVRVLSGEHEGFSRLVFLLPKDTGWSLRETPEARVLEVQNPNLRFRLNSVFTYIPKSRITQVEQIPGSANVRISTAPTTTVSTFELQSGAVVVDVLDGQDDRAVGASREHDRLPLLSFVVQERGRHALASLEGVSAQYPFWKPRPSERPE